VEAPAFMLCVALTRHALLPMLMLAQDPQQLPAAALLRWRGNPQSPRGGVSSPRSPLGHAHPQPGSPSRLGSPSHAATAAAGGSGSGSGGAGSSGSGSGGRLRRPAAAAGAGRSRPGTKGRQAHVLAALSGLRPPPLRSHLVENTWVTPVQSEVLRWVGAGRQAS
jgi:hypothetical protein